MFCTDRRGRRSLQICTIFVILIVGATTTFSEKTCGWPSGRPSFIKISFRLKRTVNLRSKYGRTVPTGLIVILIFICRGGVSPPDFFRVVEGANPYRFYLNFVVLSVGEGLAPPVVYKKSLRFARDAEDDVPYRFDCYP